MSRETRSSRHAIIIGGSSGMGRALSEELARDGWRVIATGRREEYVNELQQRWPGLITAQPMDIRNQQEVIQLLEKLTDQLPALDLVLIAAGTVQDNPDLEWAPEADTISTNISGFTALADWSYNFFTKQGYGHLAGITSIAALRGRRIAPAYNASKAYQVNYLEGLRQKAQFDKLPITITDIRPGFVATSMADEGSSMLTADVEKATKQIYKAIRAKKRIAYITKRWSLISQALRFMPSFLYERL